MNLPNSWEMEKCRGYWRAKGFNRPVFADVRIEREDCFIVYRYRSWQRIENGQTKPSHKARTLNALLASFT